MLKISTHNSASAERSRGLLSRLVRPFSRCQRLTIRQQFDAGCRYFDIRLRHCRDGVYRIAHGLWTGGRTLTNILSEIEMLAGSVEETVYVAFCLERGGLNELLMLQAYIAVLFPTHRFVVTYWATKEGGWHIEREETKVPLRADFAYINASTWRILLPIPRLWAWLRKQPTFDEETFTQVDFL